MGRNHRIGLAAALWALVIVCLTAAGGVGFAKSSLTAAQYQYGKKVTICHKDKVTITISRSALPAHKAHGDELGLCKSAKKKAKKKAEKAEGEKEKAEKAKAKAEEKAKTKAKAEKKKGHGSSDEEHGKGGEQGDGGKGSGKKK
jgi:hypothetical protein